MMECQWLVDDNGVHRIVLGVWRGNWGIFWGWIIFGNDDWVHLGQMECKLIGMIQEHAKNCTKNCSK